MRRSIILLVAVVLAATACAGPSSPKVVTTSPHIAAASYECDEPGCIPPPITDTVVVCSTFGGPISVTPLEGAIVNAKILTYANDLLLDEPVGRGETALAARPLDPIECVTVHLEQYGSLRARIDF